MNDAFPAPLIRAADWLRLASEVFPRTSARRLYLVSSRRPECRLGTPYQRNDQYLLPGILSPFEGRVVIREAEPTISVDHTDQLCFAFDDAAPTEHLNAVKPKEAAAKATLDTWLKMPATA